MTRINVGIDVKELPNDLLFTEYREMTRIPNAILTGKAKWLSDFSDIPPTFRLGEGHVKFFYNKLTFLYRRYLAVQRECYEREIGIQDTASSFTALMTPEFANLWGDYEPRPIDRQIILRRFDEKGHVLRPITN